jgi:hypothetical protein
VKATRDSRRYSNGVVSNDNNNQKAVIIENFRVPSAFVEENVAGSTVAANSNESSSLYMAAKILTDFKRTRQEPVPDVPINRDKENESIIVEDEDED